MSQPFRILISTDDPTTRVVIRRAVEPAGYEVQSVEGDSPLLDLVRQHRPDVILVDGPLFEVPLGRALASHPETTGIPVLYLVDSSRQENVVQAFAAGASDCIARPFTTQEVLARIEARARLYRAEHELARRNSDLEELNSKLAAMWRKDPLTNLLNRRSWEELVMRQHELFERYGNTYSVVMIDVDHFRAYNEAYGHAAGDDCLCRIADAIEAVCRRVDLVGRYGEEVFAVLAPETVGERATKLADRIHRAIWALGIAHAAGKSPARITASVGVACSAPGNWEDVLHRADTALGVAKRAGRNMVYVDQANAASAAGQVPSAETSHEPVKESIEVLVVDDDPTNRAVCRGCLQRTGYRIREAVDGREALAQVDERAPDVIIMDVMMPVMDGLECTRALRENPDTRDIPIIIVSALSRTEDILAGLQAGADEYISKPIRASELLIRVQSMVRLHRERVDLLRSYEQRGHQMRVLTRLVEFCRAVGLCKEPQEVLQHTVSTVADVMGCRRVSIMLPSEDDTSLTIASSIGVDEQLVRDVRIAAGSSIAGQVFTSGHPYVVNNDSETGERPSDYDAPYFASVPLISAPLDAAGRVVGVLNATDKVGRSPFEGRDLEYIELISKVAGTALHDLRMREARDQASDSIMVALASLAECRDNDTGKHLERVTRFCHMLAETMRETDPYRDQIDDDFLHSLERAVPLHDIGKVGIPDSILQFPGKLTDEQMAIMRTHAEAGANTIESLMSRAPGVRFLEMARDIARHHHERWDGRGYPDGLAGPRIPLSARITAVADVYDALTTKRVYKEAFSHDRAVSIILEGSGTAFDPDVIEAFTQREKAFAELAESMADVLPPPAPKPRDEPALTAS